MSKKQTSNQLEQTLKRTHWLLLGLFFSFAVLLVQKNVTDFKASVIPTKIAKPYDGLTLPVLNVPKWTDLTSEQRDLHYDQIPRDKIIQLPKYDPETLKIPVETLKWTDIDIDIRNAKTTYSVAYMGNYKLDGVEYAGSHLAVDIKVPHGTPVYAIGNGVAEVIDQSTGFGKHIIIKHENFPSFEDFNKKVVYYSSYNHLGQLLIADGDVVNKGQLIALSGDTGTATTPHVHFQIDNDEAPWHPYWPFTFQESTAAGLSFHEAVNAGLGKEKALATTVNPLLYIQKYMDSAATAIATEIPQTVDPVIKADNSENIANVESDVLDTILKPSADEAAIEPKPNAVSYRLSHDGYFIINFPEKFVVEALDTNGNVISNYQPQNDLYLQVLDGSAVLPGAIGFDSFVNGRAEFEVKPDANLKLKLRVSDNNISGDSAYMEIDLSAFPDVDPTSKHYEAIRFLKNHEVIGGYDDGTFRGTAAVNRVEALKFIVNGINLDLLSGKSLPFKDTIDDSWYADFIATGLEEGVVDGYPDLTFKPANTVNKAEFIKMLLLAAKIDVPLFVREDVAKDVKREDWFAVYFEVADDLNILDKENGKFSPQNFMTREEVAEAIYRIVVLKINGTEKFDESLGVAANKAQAYFS